MTSLSFTPEDAGGDAYGKTVSELQENVKIINNRVYGRLHYVKDFTGFSSDPEEQKGNYLVTKISADEEAEVKFKLIGGTAAEKTLPPDDHQIVWRIRNTNQRPQITITKGGVTQTVEYNLGALKLDPEV